MSLQKLLDVMAASERRSRGKYHLTLGQLINRLASIKCRQQVALTGAISGYPDEAMSYRGYYDDLSFSPSESPITRTELLKRCRSSLNKSFVGYKGGDFIMDEDTPLWVSGYGVASEIAIMDVIQKDNQILLVTKSVG